MPDQPVTAAPEWHEDPNVISWDWRGQPDLVELSQLLGRHGLTVEQVDTGTDDYAIRITAAPPVEPGPVHYRTHLGILAADADHRREWAAALRWAAASTVLNPSERAAVLNRADRIEAGTLTPWTDNPEPATAPAQDPCPSRIRSEFSDHRLHTCQHPAGHTGAHQRGGHTWTDVAPGAWRQTPAVPPQQAQDGPQRPHPSTGTPDAADSSTGLSERWRVGRKIPRNLYRETPDHPDGQDIGRMDTAELAAQVVEAVNAQQAQAAGHGDGPGWHRAYIVAFTEHCDADAAAQITALLADLDAHRGALRRASGDRDQAMIELLAAQREVEHAGPGWSRDAIQDLIRRVTAAESEHDFYESNDGDGALVTALLADRDQLREALTYECDAHQQAMRWKNTALEERDALFDRGERYRVEAERARPVVQAAREWRAQHGPQRHCGHCDMVLTWTDEVCINCGQDEAVLVGLAAAVDQHQQEEGQ